MGYGGLGGDLPADASNVLLSSPAMNAVANDVCAELATKEADPSDLAMMVITYRDTAEEVLADLRERFGQVPADVTVVSIGERQRIAAGSTPKFGSGLGEAFDGSATPRGEPTVETVESPSDLTGLGIAMSDRLVEWDQERWSPGPSALTICYDSLTALLQHVDERRAYRFLHILTRRIESAGVTANFHLDPAAHDPQTVSLLESLFDASIDVTEHGVRSVRHR